MLKYLTHKLKTQSINEENSNEKVRKFPENLGKVPFSSIEHLKVLEDCRE